MVGCDSGVSTSLLEPVFTNCLACGDSWANSSLSAIKPSVSLVCILMDTIVVLCEHSSSSFSSREVAEFFFSLDHNCAVYELAKWCCFQGIPSIYQQGEQTLSWN